MTKPQTPLVTVCIPTRDRAPFLVQSIESVLSQSYPNIELVVADDASTDNTRAVVECYGSRVHYVFARVHVGMARNWLAALQAGGGKYVAILNDDDYYHRDMIRTLIEPLELHPEVGISFCDHFVTDDVGRILLRETNRLSRITRRSHLREGLVKDPLLWAVRSNAFPIIGSLFRYEAIRRAGYIDATVETAPDLDLFYRITAANAAFYTPERLSYFRLHNFQSTAGPGSVSMLLKNLESVVRALSNIQTSDRKIERARQIQLANVYSQMALAGARRGISPSQATAEALASWSWSPRYLRRLLLAQAIWATFKDKGTSPEKT